MTNQKNYVLYTGVTNNIKLRVYQHKNGIGSKFTKIYKIDKLVYLEEYDNINNAIAREKQLKADSRQSKVDLIIKFNPHWQDLGKEK